MADPETVTACLILIGNEILSGRTQDKNLSFIGNGLNEVGINYGRLELYPMFAKQ